MERVRHSVQSPEGLKNLKIYGEAVELMRKRPAEDPFSWAYQAGIHGTEDPNLKGKPFIDNCPHYHEFQAKTDTDHFFLIWHRLYLHYHEEIVRALTGIESFTMPYWDSTDPNQRTLPTAFLSEELGGFKGLFDDSRINNLNDGITKIAADDSTRIDRARQDLQEKGRGDFLSFNEAINYMPHGFVHNEIGGNMSTFETAGLDPIFWVHHANIDRLWAEYGKDPVEPEEIKKLTPGMTIGFFDRDGQPVTYSYEEAAEEIYEFDYRYDTGATPTKPAQASTLATADTAPLETTVVNQALASLVHGDVIVNWPAQPTQSRQKTRPILSITIEASPELAGYIDIFYADHGTGRRDLLPNQNLPFDELTAINGGRFIEQYYLGSMSFVPHGYGMDDSSMDHDHSHHEHSEEHGGHSESTAPTKHELVFHFDISQEMRLQRNLSRLDDVVHFNIDPTQDNAMQLGEVTLKSIGMIYA